MVENPRVKKLSLVINYLKIQRLSGNVFVKFIYKSSSITINCLTLIWFLIILLQIWDTAGQERFKSLRTPFYRGSDICLLTFSLDDKVSFQNLMNWREEFLYYADVNDKPNFPFVVIGNKVDIEPEKRVIPKETVLDWCAANGNLPYVETSAKESTNVVPAFQLAVEKWSKLDSRMDKPYTGQTVNLTSRHGVQSQSNGQSTATSSCCFQWRWII